MTYRLDPPDDDGPDPDRCACGEPLQTMTVGPDGECDSLCAVCDERMIAGELGGCDDVVAELRAIREQIEAEAPESGEVSF